MQRLLFYILHSSFFILLATAAFVFLSPSILAPDLIYPQRIDSIYVQFQKEQFLKEHNDEAAADSLFIFNPSDLGLKYENFDVRTIDSLTLKGWYIPADDSEAVSMLVLHDWNESKIMRLNFAKQMRDRGFNIYLVDMRAHGNSGGLTFSPAIISVNDVKNITDYILNKYSTNHLVLMGSGVSATIVMQSALFDGRYNAIVAQCPIESFEKFLKKYAYKQWGSLDRIFYPVLKRKFEALTLQHVRGFQMNDFASEIKTPTLLIGVSDDAYYSPFDAYSLFEKLATDKKNLILIDKATHDNIEIIGGDQYYNRIAEFINNAIPKKSVKVRNKKLA